MLVPTRFFRPLLLVAAFIFSASPVLAQGFDHSALDHFLKQYVDSNGQVNYAEAKKNHSELDRYLEQIKNVDLSLIQIGPKPELLAFWLNVYHAGLLSLILKNYPLKSTQELPSFWELEFLKVGLEIIEEKELYSLSQIRSQVLIPMFQDEKIHFTLALGAKDGPLFPREVFTGPHVRGQLFLTTRREVARSEIVKINKEMGKVLLSRIFQWYAPDFATHFGRPKNRGDLSFTETTIANFLIRYSKGLDRIRFLKTGKYTIEYASFDWTLNDTASAVQ